MVGSLALSIAVAALLACPAQARSLEIVEAVSDRELPAAVAALLSSRDRAQLAQQGERAGVQIRFYEELNGAVVIVGDPFGLERRRRVTGAVEELASRLAKDSSVQLGDLSPAARSAVVEFVDEHARWMYGAKVADAGAGAVGVGVGWAISLTGGGKSIETFVDNGATNLARTSEIRLEPLPPEPKGGAKLGSEQASTASGPSSLVRFTVRPGFTAIAARARLMREFLTEVEDEAAGLFKRFEAAADSLEIAGGGTKPAVGQTFDALDPGQQARLIRNRGDHFAAYGFQSAEAAQSWLRGARVGSVYRQVQIRVKVRLPDGSIEGFTSSIQP